MVLDLLHIDKGFSKTLVIFHAALAGSKVTSYPLFSGLGVARDIHANVICVSDPSLALDLELAWFAGNISQPLQTDLPNVLRHLLSYYSESQEVAFFGASGGGFASLFYSHGFPGSSAISINPQLDLTKYSPSPVAKYSDRAWDGQDLRTAPFIESLDRLYKAGFPNKVFLLQNVQDGHHRDRHVASWLRVVPSMSKNLNLLAKPWGRGHVPPDKETIISSVNAILANDREQLDSIGFKQSPGRRHLGEQYLSWKASLKAE